MYSMHVARSSIVGLIIFSKELPSNMHRSITTHKDTHLKTHTHTLKDTNTLKDTKNALRFGSICATFQWHPMVGFLNRFWVT